MVREAQVLTVEHKMVCEEFSFIECAFADIDIALRIEWCRARARAHRWQEECLFLAEEMRRIKQYFTYREEWWQTLASNAMMITDGSTDSFAVLPALEAIRSEENQRILDGKRAYALRQADIQVCMSQACEVEWEGLSDKLLTMEGRDARVMVEHE